MAHVLQNSPRKCESVFTVLILSGSPRVFERWLNGLGWPWPGQLGSSSSPGSLILLQPHLSLFSGHWEGSRKRKHAKPLEAWSRDWRRVISATFQQRCWLSKVPREGSTPQCSGSHGNLKENFHNIQSPWGPAHEQGRYFQIPCSRNTRKLFFHRLLDRKWKKGGWKIKFL